MSIDPWSYPPALILWIWMKRGTVRVKRLAQKHNGHG